MDFRLPLHQPGRLVRLATTNGQLQTSNGNVCNTTGFAHRLGIRTVCGETTLYGSNPIHRFVSNRAGDRDTIFSAIKNRRNIDAPILLLGRVRVNAERLHLANELVETLVALCQSIPHNLFQPNVMAGR